MINEKSIMDKVKAFSKTPDAKNKMRGVIEKCRMSGTALSNGKMVIPEENITELSMKMILCVYKNLPPSIEDVGSSMNIEKNVIVSDVWNIVSIYFDKQAIRRESLYNEGYPNGVDNIVALLNNGYSSGNYVYGFWHGKDIRSKKARNSEYFMQDAVLEFNSLYSAKYNVLARLNDVYK